MYLTFNRVTKELINYSDGSEGHDGSIINGNKFGIVYFDEYTVTIKRDDVDFIETQFDESMQLEVFVPGQHVLSENVNNYIEVLDYMNEVLKVGNKLIEEQLILDIDPLPVSYVIYMGQLALKDESEYSDSEKKIVFHEDKDVYVSLMNKTMKLFNSIDSALGDFNKKIKSADTKEAIDLALNELKAKL